VYTTQRGQGYKKGEMAIVGKRERKYGKVRGWLCRLVLNILSVSNLAYAAMCIVERKNKYKKS